MPLCTRVDERMLILHSSQCCRSRCFGEQPWQRIDIPDQCSGACCRSHCSSSCHPGWRWSAAKATWRRCRTLRTPGDDGASGEDLHLTWEAVKIGCWESTWQQSGTRLNRLALASMSLEQQIRDFSQTKHETVKIINHQTVHHFVKPEMSPLCFHHTRVRLILKTHPNER